MRYLSVCSGIEAATVAWHPLGWEAAGFAEIDKFPSAVLSHHYPDVPNFGDFTTIEASDAGPIDLLVGGTPCQSFSIAGLRGGMADDRGNLALEYLRLAQRTRPRWIVFENVCGILSSNKGRDFGSLLGALVELGYGFAYRVLDAQYVRVDGHPRAVPQRRRRVFVVGYLGDWRRAAAVLFERESMSGNSPPSRKARKDIAPMLSSRPSGGGGLGTDFDLDGGLIAKTLNARGGSGRSDAESETFVAHTLKAATHHTGRPEEDTYIVAFAIQERAVAENSQSGPDGIGVRNDGASYTLEARSQAQAVAFEEIRSGGVRLCGATGQRTNGLTTGGGKPGEGYQVIAYDMRGRDGGAQNVAYPISADADRANSQALTPSRDASGYVRLRHPGLGIGVDGDPMFTLQATKPHAIAYDMRGVVEPWAVRRLTPTECERLQGFPDGYTQVPYRNKPAFDSPRYKALGNSMACNVMRWIGQRIDRVDKL